DVVAVLAVDRAGPQEAGDGNETARRMIDIRFGLQQIVPGKGDVGMPVGTAIPLALRNVTIEQGQDISRALLSHLAPLLDGARVRIGLAQCGSDQSPLAALNAANNALLRLQRLTVGELIAAANEDDEQRIGASAASADGIFAPVSDAGASRGYLAQIAALTADPQRGEDYLAEVIAITLGQAGVSAVAIYRRRFDDDYEFVQGAAGSQGGVAELAEKELPRPLRQLVRKLDTAQLAGSDRIGGGKAAAAAFPLRLYERVLGYMALHYVEAGAGNFRPDAATLHHLAVEIARLADWRQAKQAPSQPQPVAPRPLEDQIDGYVGDNMEGAIDQAVFLSRLDVPVAVIGPRGTGKLYVAKVIHQESGGTPEQLVAIDCREFRGRKDALNRIARELERSRGKTLVFKSPHLMNPDAQLKLARQISSRILADTNPPRYLPTARIIALFPDSLEHLVRFGGLNDRLASVFAAYPIRVPPIKDRKRAVLRWAHKILAQEAVRRDRKLAGFTPDAEQAMLQHEWPGNISEMRECIVNALDKTAKEWITPVDLGLFKGLSPAGRAGPPARRAFLQALVDMPEEEEAYTPTTLEELSVALGEALHSLLELEAIKPLGSWLDDEVILAVCERYRDNMRAAADFLQTKPRNIGRWMPKVLSRDHERSSSSLWQTPHRLIRQWIKEAGAMEAPPQDMVQRVLMSHVQRQCEGLSVADRARIMGVSVPTYQKRVQDMQNH
ncbi:MAG: sigma 54-interacting transcriptional regulator, partial [Halieaceae bacterium]|nr:sigma 54-interacting transcriptional regulator [Halieaceae bacterium]